MSFLSFHQLAVKSGSSTVLRLHIQAVSRPFVVRAHSPWLAITPAQITQRRGSAHGTRKADSRYLPISKFTYAAFALCCLTSLALITEKPLLLEGNQPEDEEYEWREFAKFQQRYVPVTLPASLETAEANLDWVSSSELVQGGSNVLRVDSVGIGSNQYPEDYACLVTGIADHEVEWIIAGIFDGHAGWQTAEALYLYLPNYIMYHISQVLPPDVRTFSAASSRALDKALKAAFLELDEDLMEEATAAVNEPRYLNEALPALQPAYAGSCALVSYYNSDTKILKVACTGDSRAVLGRRNAAGEWEAIPLSEDQTGYSEAEKARLRKEHPDEPDMIKDGRLFGLAVTRAFGDSRWKWPRELQEQARDRLFGPQLREPLLTPPYLTAEPVITTTEIQPKKGDFLIQASDGLWDELTSAQAVDLVGRWLKSNDPTKRATPADLSRTEAANVLVPGQTTTKTLSKKENHNQNQNQSQNQGYRINPAGKRPYGNLGRIQERDFVVKDANAAVHLARNALGGGDEDRLCGLLSAHPPHSRNMRDDISVQVIFFGNDPNVIYT